MNYENSNEQEKSANHIVASLHTSRCALGLTFGASHVTQSGIMIAARVMPVAKRL